MIFKLDTNGKFNIKLKYEVDETRGIYENNLTWPYNEIGLIPDDDYSKSILEKYLSKKLD